MTRRNILLIVVFLLLGSLCAYVYRDRFRSAPIQIGHRSMEPRGAMIRRAKNSNTDVVLFLLNRELKLTSIQVIPVSNIETNKHPQPIWELVSDSNSVPVKEFFYGNNIRGMRPAVKGAVAGSLEPDVKYRLYLSAGSHKAEHEFIPQARNP